MDMTLNVNLDFMRQTVAGIDDNQRMTARKQDNSGIIDFNIERGEDDAGIFSRKSSGQFEENNMIRQQLVDALKTQFGKTTVLDLPKSVKNALNIGLFRDDMKIDENGKVTSGRPLTARRIRTVISAVEAELDMAKGIAQAEADYRNDMLLQNKAVNDRIMLYFISCARMAPASLSTLFDGGIDARNFEKFGRTMYKFEKRLILAMPPAMMDAAEGGDGEIWRLVISDVVVGSLSRRSRIELRYFINSEECSNYMRAQYDIVNEGNLPDDETREINSALDYLATLRLAVAKFCNIEAKKI